MPSGSLPTIGFIGTGRIAGALARGLSRAGYEVAAVASRTEAAAVRLAATLPGCAVATPQGVAEQADFTFITTPDDAIAEVASSVRWRPGKSAVHCSGALTLEPLAAARAAGALVGSLHPVQTFAADAPEGALAGVTFGIEADPLLSSMLADMARALGGTPLSVPPEARVLYHAAAVMSCGYLVALLHAAAALWRCAGLPEETGQAALGRLARTTLDNLLNVGPQAALTGPIARGDLSTVRSHLDAMRGAAPDQLETYAALGARTAALVGSLAAAWDAATWDALFAEYTGPVTRGPIGG